MVDLRDATRADAHAIANVLVQSWRAAYRGLLPDDVLAGLSIPTGNSSVSDVLAARPPGLAKVAELDVGVETCLFGLDGSEDVNEVVGNALQADPWGVRHCRRWSAALR
jgi:hypothetical protein